MEARELRIGNYVLEKRREEFIQFRSFAGLSNFEASAWEFEPIHLTEEWLLKFGFKKEDDGLYIYEFGRHYFRIGLGNEWNDLYYREDIGMDGIVFKPSMDYVHQLQNLIYVITGEELELKN